MEEELKSAHVRIFRVACGLAPGSNPGPRFAATKTKYLKRIIIGPRNEL